MPSNSPDSKKDSTQSPKTDSDSGKKNPHSSRRRSSSSQSSGSEERRSSQKSSGQGSRRKSRSRGGKRSAPQPVALPPPVPQDPSELSIGSFSQFPLILPLQQALHARGFTEPTPIQQEAIPVFLEGGDLIGQAQTGTGKTLAFAIPALQRLDLELDEVQILVLCPTRELALQVTSEFDKMTLYYQGVEVVPIYGGQPIVKQFSRLRHNPQIVVGTPGRVLDHLRRGSLKLNHVSMAILDEADEMLDMGFREDIEDILRNTPKTRQTALFSATMPPAILNLTHQYQHDAKHVKIDTEPEDEALIDEYFSRVEFHAKRATLCKFLEDHSFDRGLIFCNTKRAVDLLVIQMKNYGLDAEGLHGGMNQSQRDRIMRRFRQGNRHLLVATDVAARGIDVKDIDVVVNYDFPTDVETYIHRIGRTGRAGKTGVAFSLVDFRDSAILKMAQNRPQTNLSLYEAPGEEGESEEISPEQTSSSDDSDATTSKRVSRKKAQKALQSQLSDTDTDDDGEAPSPSEPPRTNRVKRGSWKSRKDD